MTSASRTDPPGCTTAVAPASATASRPSRNGKNASDAATEPCERRPAARLHHRDLHGVDAAHLPGADRQRAIGRREDHRVRLHVRAHAPGEAQRRPLLRRRLRAWSRPSARRRPATARALRSTRSRSCDSTPPRTSGTPTGARRRRQQRVEVGRHDPQVLLRRQNRARGLVHRRRDHRLDERRRRCACAVSTSSGRFSPTMPPKADSGSASRART